MTLENLEEFKFNLDTYDMLKELKTDSNLDDIFKSVDFNENIINLINDNRRILNSILLRLNIYSMNNINETTVRNNLNCFKKYNIDDLLNYFYNNTSKNDYHELNDTLNINDNDQNSDSEEDPFENFFNVKILETEESTDVLKTSEIYTSFTKWWALNYDDDLPDKKELKSYLTNKLGKSKQNTWNNLTFA